MTEAANKYFNCKGEHINSHAVCGENKRRIQNKE